MRNQETNKPISQLVYSSDEGNEASAVRHRIQADGGIADGRKESMYIGYRFVISVYKWPEGKEFNDYYPLLKRGGDGNNKHIHKTMDQIVNELGGNSQIREASGVGHYLDIFKYPEKPKDENLLQSYEWLVTQLGFDPNASQESKEIEGLLRLTKAGKWRKRLKIL